jgi:hypothetical protein
MRCNMTWMKLIGWVLMGVGGLMVLGSLNGTGNVYDQFSGVTIPMIVLLLGGVSLFAIGSRLIAKNRRSLMQWWRGA